MAALVDVTGHALLSGKAVDAAAGPAFAAQELLAEALLGLDATFVSRLSAAQLERVKMAVALQVNFQLEQGLDPFVVQSEQAQVQGESRTYRGDAVHPQALAIVQAIELAQPDVGAQQVVAFRRTASVRSARTAGGGGVPTRKRLPPLDALDATLGGAGYPPGTY